MGIIATFRHHVKNVRWDKLINIIEDLDGFNHKFLTDDDFDLTATWCDGEYGHHQCGPSNEEVLPTF